MNFGETQFCPYQYQKELKIETQTFLYISEHDSIVYRSQRLETTQVSINRWMDKQNVVYPYNGILFSHNEEGSADTYYSVGESWKHYAKWKKLDRESQILYDSTNMKYVE